MTNDEQQYFKNLREEYRAAQLIAADLNEDPLLQFDQWFREAVDFPCPQANAMALATADRNGGPSLRMVLLKDVNTDGFTFYTNYGSNKGRQLQENPVAALMFYWHELHRQVRIEGNVTKVSREVSGNYFRTRPFMSKIGALASRQSREIEDRETLRAHCETLAQEYDGKEVPLPEDWGGYLLRPEKIEFWQGQENRLHDRIVYVREDNRWKKHRLSP